MELKDTINDFKGVLEGKYDDLPEMAFYMVSAAWGAAHPAGAARKAGVAHTAGC